MTGRVYPRNGATGGASVEFRHVSKQFESQRNGATVAAVNDLSFTVQPGEICVLVGPSGCGKTTSLKMVNRLVEPTSGTILIDGEDIRKIDPVTLRRQIGYVIQQVGLFPHRTVAENVATVPELLGWPRERIRKRVDELIALVGLDPASYRNRYPAQLSGGERQRIGVARAMAVEPPLMLMDEPFGAVDPLVRERLQDEFLDLQHRLGITVLFVTHDIDEAIKLGTKVAVFERGGRLAQFSPPAELLMQPANDYVARFVGADRALKRLAVMQVRELGLDRTRTLPEDAPTFTPETNVRDVLAAILPSPYQAGVVRTAEGQPLGVVTLAAIGDVLRAQASGAPPRRTE
ncbi:MAG: ABC transporter ATP-binding protein [Chloroflexi bacterium]|nr:ABC transporter ATP-binding protein [Chloroflexota bacterium]